MLCRCLQPCSGVELPLPWYYHLVNGTVCTELYVGGESTCWEQLWGGIVYNRNASTPFYPVFTPPTTYFWSNGTCPPQYFYPLNKTLGCDDPYVALISFSSMPPEAALEVSDVSSVVPEAP